MDHGVEIFSKQLENVEQYARGTERNTSIIVLFPPKVLIQHK